jgi:hypothetical protein
MNNGCLCEREFAGTVVKLWELSGEITITVKDGKGDNFAFEIEASKAIDAFYHPFAYRERAERASRASSCLNFGDSGNSL